MRTVELKSFSKPILRSWTDPDRVRNSERWMGYCVGPALVACLYCGVSGSYLNHFYTDVLHLNTVVGGLFLTLMPIFSKILDAVTNIFMGQIIDHTKSAAGKARPWLLLSGPLMALSAIFMFAVPQGSRLITALWVVCSYNLYFCVSYTMYNLANISTIPLSTRDNKARDTLAMASSIGINMIPGLVLAVIFPSFLLPFMGVNQTKWMQVMAVLSVLAVIGTVIQYYFTRERITEDTDGKAEEAHGPEVSLKDQIKGCCSSKYWLMIIVVVIVYQFYNNFQVTSMLYYSNWVLGTYNDGKTLSLLNIIGQAMLGPGVLFLWPLVKKFGKQRIYIIGSIIAIVGGFLGFANPKNLPVVLVALTIRSIGFLPLTYVTLSLLADALDHVEWKCGYRCDGFSASIYSIIVTVSAGLSLGIFNLGLSMNGYISPAADGSWVAQPQAVQNFFTFGMYMVPTLGAFVLLGIFLFFDLEKKLPQIHADLKKRNGGEENAESENPQ